jgi:hypothetical protein
MRHPRMDMYFQRIRVIIRILDFGTLK